MELEFVIEKSHEGQFRVSIASKDGDKDAVTMPWTVGKDMAIKQVGILLARAPLHVLYALTERTSIDEVFIKNVLKRPFRD